eukprot:COSAG01_NODE_41500_length_450_cov_12.373219_1_plen_59_part_01
MDSDTGVKQTVPAAPPTPGAAEYVPPTEGAPLKRRKQDLPEAVQQDLPGVVQQEAAAAV